MADGPSSPADERGYGLVVAAFAIAFAAVAALAFAPLGTTVTVDDEGEVVTETTGEAAGVSLIESQGLGTVLTIAIPVLGVAGAPLFVTDRRTRLVRGVSAALLTVGVVLGFASIGFLLIPAAILMIIATVRSPRPEDADASA